MSLLGALGPLVKVEGQRRIWLTRVLAYTIGGALSSLTIGAALGIAGSHLQLAPAVGLLVALMLTVLILAREIGWLPFSLPQAHRQTDPRWRWFLPESVTASFWGLDVGLAFSTWMAFSGAYALAAIALAAGEPELGAAMFFAWWAGRVSSVWLSPWILTSASSTHFALDQVSATRPLLRRVHIAAIAGTVAVLSFWLSELVGNSG